MEIDNRGVWWVNVRTDKDGDIIEAEPLFLSDPIDIIGTGQDNDGAYYQIIKFKDKITRRHKTAALPQAEIGTVQGWQRLQNFSLVIMSGRAKGKTGRLFAERGSQAAFHHYRPRRVEREAYILAGGETVNADGTNILYNGDTSQKRRLQRKAASREWQDQAARYAENNSRLCLALGLNVSRAILGARTKRAAASIWRAIHQKAKQPPRGLP